MARRTGAKFPEIVLHRLYMSRINRPPMGLAALARHMKGKEDKIAVEIRWKDGERKGFDYGIDAKASHVYGDIVSLKKVADSLEDPTEDLIGVAKEGDITYAEVESIFSANGVTPSLDDRTLWVNYKWDDPEASGDTVHLDLS